MRLAKCVLVAGVLTGLAACTTAQPGNVAANEFVAANATGMGVAHPELWPAYDYPVAVNPEHEARIAQLLASMTLEEKIGQLVQADLCCVTPADMREYHLGSILVGGNSGPNGNDLSPAPDWLAAADAFYNASVDTSDGGVGIPMIWGTDAVHGHSNIIGATIFPHNIGLGAAHNPALIEQIGRVTATEIRVTGQEWTFAPTVAVPQDFRWGRAYEGYSSNPELVASYVGALLQGLQGDPDNTDLLSGPYVLASTKHFLADGGTDNGVDQGDSSISEEDLRDIHGAPYGPAIEGGVATVMASFSSWQGDQDDRQRVAAHRRSERPDGFRRLRGFRLERPRAGGGLHQRKLPAGAAGGDRHVYGPRYLARCLCRSARPARARAKCRWRGWTMPWRGSCGSSCGSACSITAHRAPARWRGNTNCSALPNIAQWRAMRCASRWCC